MPPWLIGQAGHEPSSRLRLIAVIQMMKAMASSYPSARSATADLQFVGQAVESLGAVVLVAVGSIGKRKRPSPVTSCEGLDLRSVRSQTKSLVHCFHHVLSGQKRQRKARDLEDVAIERDHETACGHGEFEQRSALLQ